MSVPSPAAQGRLGVFLAAMRTTPQLWWSFLYFFCLLSGYYVLRPVREAMAASSDVQAVFPPAMIEFFAVRGLALKDFTLQVLFTCTFIIMLLLQPAYGWLVSRYPRRVFLPAVYGFFIGTLLLFYMLFDSGMPGRGMAFFLWIAVFNLFAVAVFWNTVPSGTRESISRRAFSSAHGGWFAPPQVDSGGTVQVTMDPLGVPPLSASMNDVPVGIGSSTVTGEGGSGTVAGGHCMTDGSPCGVSHGRPKFGPPLQMPVGFERQKLFSGRGCTLVIC